MQIDSTFSVVAPISRVWDTLMDFERVAGCLPGAKILNKLSDDAYQVGMTVKLGPVTMQYKGLLNVIERNASEHRAVLGGKAQETRGQGTAEATVTLTLAEDGAATRGSVSADLALSGKAAAMGKGVIGSVTEQMMSLFANNLQAMLTEGAPPIPEAPSEPVPAAVPEPVPASAAPEPVPASAAPGGSLDALGLAKGIAAEQLASPAKVLGVVAVVACIAYWAGRRSALRLLRLCGRL
ncbi:SRPBCC family protein [Arthrobacter sp. ok362]|uniref:SRPBCC family protein n=1 Tax=Arthrobacter sp. ok362 TaxID=1761745 RepID=UPI000886DDD7|nr:SRPBCC family protein [Arthrobacter sp. ok362]SDL23049.1 Carbon monoxide dehydrogenase subunit G [Arthrobacter sp. ok362]